MGRKLSWRTCVMHEKELCVKTPGFQKKSQHSSVGMMHMGSRMAQGSVLGCESQRSISGDLRGPSPLTHHLSHRPPGEP